MQTDHYRLALLLVIASSIANSGNGLIVRSMDSAGDWQIIFYRSCFLATALGTFFVVQQRLAGTGRIARAASVGVARKPRHRHCQYVLHPRHDPHHGRQHHVPAERGAVLHCADRLDRAARDGRTQRMDRDERGASRNRGDAVGRNGRRDPGGQRSRVDGRAQLRNLRGDPAKGTRREHAAGRHSRHRARRTQRRAHERLDALDLLARRRVAVPLGDVALRHRARHLHVELAPRSRGGAHAAHPHRVHPVPDVGVARHRRAAESGDPDRRRCWSSPRWRAGRSAAFASRHGEAGGRAVRAAEESGTTESAMRQRRRLRRRPRAACPPEAAHRRFAHEASRGA